MTGESNNEVSEKSVRASFAEYDVMSGNIMRKFLAQKISPDKETWQTWLEETWLTKGPNYHVFRQALTDFSLSLVIPSDMYKRHPKLERFKGSQVRDALEKAMNEGVGDNITTLFIERMEKFYNAKLAALLPNRPKD